MPITLPPISRRRFLAGSLAAGAGVLAGPRLWAADGTTDVAIDADRFALLSDTHVSGNRDHVERGANMFEHARRVVDQLVALDPRPAAVTINGDCAFLHGEREDYAAFVESLRPLREAGLPVHCTLGNHDNRRRFWDAIPAQAGQDRAVNGQHITVIESPKANWFLLDSLQKTDVTAGKLGSTQLEWLAAELDRRDDRPAMVMLHHQPDKPDGGGLTDTKALLEVLRPRRQVKAYFFGHTHVWTNRDQDGLHLVNLPPVAYVFSPEQPSGWVDARLSDAGAAFTLHSLDTTHPKHGKTVELSWRT
jgi:Icc protein